MRKGTLPSLIAVLSLASLPVFAADNGIYLGGSVGVSGISENDINYNANATGFKVIAGWRFIDWLSIEGNYVDFGSGSDTAGGEKIKTDGNGLSVSALGFLPLGPVDLFARVGVFDWSAHLSSESIGKFGDNGTDITYGAGAQFRIWSMSLRGEYERFDLGGTDVDLFSVGFTWTFF
jgi:hypothetical protein